MGGVGAAAAGAQCATDDGRRVRQVVLGAREVRDGHVLLPGWLQRLRLFAARIHGAPNSHIACPLRDSLPVAVPSCISYCGSPGGTSGACVGAAPVVWRVPRLVLNARGFVSLLSRARRSTATFRGGLGGLATLQCHSMRAIARQCVQPSTRPCVISAPRGWVTRAPIVSIAVVS